jgi:hypothetical protein
LGRKERKDKVLQQGKNRQSSEERREQVMVEQKRENRQRMRRKERTGKIQQKGESS